MIEGMIGLFVIVAGFISWVFSSEIGKNNGDGDASQGNDGANGGLKIKRIVSIDLCGRLSVDFASAQGGQLTHNVPIKISGLQMPKGVDDAATWARGNISQMIFQLLSRDKIVIIATNVIRGKDGILEGDIIVDGKSLLMSLRLSPYIGEQPEKKKPQTPKVEYIPVPGFDPRQFQGQQRPNGMYFDDERDSDRFDRFGRRVA